MAFPKFLRIAIVPHRHMLEVNTDEQNATTLSSGVEADFINLLSQSLGFKYELHIPKKGGWSAMFEIVHQNQSDIGIGHAMITERRMQMVDFVPYLVQSNTFATKLSEYLPKTAAFAKPFEWRTWLLFFAVSFFVPLLIHSLMANKVALARLYSSLIGCYFQQSLNIVGKDERDRILIGGWMVYAFVLSSSYTAMLLSSLTVPSRERGISTIEELSQAVSDGRYSCYSLRGTAGTRHLLDAEEEYLNVIGRSIVQKTWKSDNDTIGLPDEIEDNVAILGARFFFLLEYGEPPHTKAKIFEESITNWNVGMAVNKGFCCKKRLETVVSRLLSSGIYQKFYDKVVFTNRLNKELKANHESNFKPLTLNDLSGAFLLLGLGLGLSFIVFAFENIHYHLNKSPKNCVEKIEIGQLYSPACVLDLKDPPIKLRQISVKKRRKSRTKILSMRRERRVLKSK